jgi:hypothetical protein
MYSLYWFHIITLESHFPWIAYKHRGDYIVEAVERKRTLKYQKRVSKIQKSSRKPREVTEEEKLQFKKLEESYRKLCIRVDYWNDRVYTRRYKYGISLKFEPETVFEKVLAQYCSVKWDWKVQSSNPLITEHFIDSHPDKEWNWGQNGLSRNPVVTPELVEIHKTKPWYYGQNGLSMNPSMTLEFIKANPKKPWHWGYGGLSMNPIMIPEFIKANPSIPWHWGEFGISFNPSITLEFIREYMSSKGFSWGAYGLSRNPVVTPEFVLENLDKPWCWKSLSSHRKMTLEFIKKHPELPWDYSEVLKNRNFGLKDFYEFPFPRSFYEDMTDSTGLIANPSLSFEEAEEQFNELLELYHNQSENETIEKSSSSSSSELPSPEERLKVIIMILEKICTREDLPRKFIQKHSKWIVKKIYQDPFVINDMFNVFYSRNYLSL